MPLRPQGYDPHEKHTSPWDLLVTAAHLARRVVWLLISYVRVSLLFVWYCLMVLAWEQHCWSESCVACPSTNPDPTPTPTPTPNRTPNPNQAIGRPDPDSEAAMFVHAGGEVLGYVEHKGAQPSASWLSGGCFQHDRASGLPQASAGLGQSVAWSALAGHTGLLPT